jgi:hypothetical protein
MTIGVLIAGSAVKSLMVWTPVPLMLNVIKSASGVALASRMACLKEPAPKLFVLVTTKDKSRSYRSGRRNIVRICLSVQPGADERQEKLKYKVK